MSKQKRYRVIAAAIALCAFPLAIVFMVPASRIPEENYQRLETGMTVQQVESILGERPTYLPDTAGVYSHQCWHSKQGEVIVVVFHKNQGLVNSSYRRTGAPPRGMMEKRWDRIFPWIPWRHRHKPLDWYPD